MLRTESERSLVRAIGVWGLAAGIFNTTVGGGIFRLPAAVSGMIGAAAPIVYVVCAVTMGLIVLCFAEAGSRVSLTGVPSSLNSMMSSFVTNSGLSDRDSR